MEWSGVGVGSGMTRNDKARGARVKPATIGDMLKLFVFLRRRGDADHSPRASCSLLAAAALLHALSSSSSSASLGFRSWDASHAVHSLPPSSARSLCFLAKLCSGLLLSPNYMREKE